jgi:hypothetical protein
MIELDAGTVAILRQQWKRQASLLRYTASLMSSDTA